MDRNELISPTPHKIDCVLESKPEGDFTVAANSCKLVFLLPQPSHLGLRIVCHAHYQYRTRACHQNLFSFRFLICAMSHLFCRVGFASSGSHEDAKLA